MKRFLFINLLIIILMSCNPGKSKEKSSGFAVHLVTLDPGHFHAALVQKSMYPQVDSTVYVYAPEGNDLQLHLNRINVFNTRTDNPAHWKEEVYTGPDYLKKMLEDKKGNVVVIAGNNRDKTEYILQSIESGFHVLADKPMVINSEDFETLKLSFETAKQKKLLLYDIMTERFEITTMLQREFAMLPALFGTLEKGSNENPAIVMESGHCFYKFVSGNILTRPAWCMDVSQQGEGIVDVTTHLIDLSQWEAFPGQSIDYAKDIEVYAARRWPTSLTLAQFKVITKLDSFPAYLRNIRLNDSTLGIFANGEIRYKLKDVFTKVSVHWDFQTPGGTDTHYSLFRGSKANLVIRQEEADDYKPTLYIDPVSLDEKTFHAEFLKVEAKYPGIKSEKNGNGWKVSIPEKYKEGHEAHFARVMENFLSYLDQGKIPMWETSNMLAKYYITTKALELSKK